MSQSTTTDCIKCGEPFNYSDHNSCPNCGASLPREDVDDDEDFESIED